MLYMRDVFFSTGFRFPWLQWSISGRLLDQSSPQTNIVHSIVHDIRPFLDGNIHSAVRLQSDRLPEIAEIMKWFGCQMVRDGIKLPHQFFCQPVKSNKRYFIRTSRVPERLLLFDNRKNKPIDGEYTPLAVWSSIIIGSSLLIDV